MVRSLSWAAEKPISVLMNSSSSSLIRPLTGLLSVAAIVVLCGCTKLTVSSPKRTAIDQLIISTAADNSLRDVDFSTLRGKKVFLDEKYYESTDSKYVLGAVRDAISSAGAFLMADVKEAEIVVEARSGALSFDQTSSLVGIPEMPVPIPFTGTLVLPEAPFWKSEKNDAISKLALLAYDNTTRAHVMSTGSLVGRSHYRHYTVLGILKFQRTNVPEKRKL